MSDGTLSEISSLSQQQAGEKLTPETMKATAEKVLNVLQTLPTEEAVSEGSLSGVSSLQSPLQGEVKEEQNKVIEKVTAIMRAVVSGEYVPDENVRELEKLTSPVTAEETAVSVDSKRKADLILTELRTILHQEDVSECDTYGAISPILCETAAAVPSQEDNLETAAKLIRILHADPMAPSISEGSLSELSCIQDPSTASTREQSVDSLQLAVATKVLAAAKAAETEVSVSEDSVGKIECAFSPQEAKQIFTPEETSMAVQKALEILQAVCVGEEVPKDSLRELERVLSPVEAAARITSPLMETEVKQMTGVEEAIPLPTVESPAEANDRITSPLLETKIIETTGVEETDFIATTATPVKLEERVTSPLQTALATETAGVQDTEVLSVMSATEVKEEGTLTLQPLQIIETVGVEGADSMSEISSPKEAEERITSPLQVLRIEETDGVEETESLPSLASSAMVEGRITTPLQSTEVSDIAAVEETKNLDSASPVKASERLTTPLEVLEVNETAGKEGVDNQYKVNSQTRIMEVTKPPVQPLQVTEPSEMREEPDHMSETSDVSQADAQRTITPLEVLQVTETSGVEDASALPRVTAEKEVAASVHPLVEPMEIVDVKVIETLDMIHSPDLAEVQERLTDSQLSVGDDNIVSETVIESLDSTLNKAAEESASVFSPDATMSELEAQIKNVKVLSAPEVSAELSTQDIMCSEEVEMQEEDNTSMKSSDSIVTVTSLRKQESVEPSGEEIDTLRQPDEPADEKVGALQQPSEVRQILHAMEMLSSVVCTAAAATLSPEEPAEGRVEVLANDFLVSLQSLCGELETDRLRVTLNNLCDKVKVNDKLSQEAAANVETLQALEGVSPMIHRTIYPKVNQVCEEIERLAVEAGAAGNTPQAAASNKGPEDALGDQVQKLVDAVEETNQMKLRTLKHPVDDNSISRKFDDINNSVVHLAETVKKIVSNAMTGSGDLSLQVTAVQQSLAVTVVTLTDLISNDGLRDEAIKLLAAVNGGISRVSDAAEVSAKALKSDDSPEMNLAIQALLDETLKDIVAATNKFKEDMKEVTMTIRDAAATSPEDGISKFLMQGEKFDEEVEELTMAIENITAKKKRVASDVKSMKKISGESADARTSVDAILKMMCNTVTGASKADEDQALEAKLIETDAHLESLGQKFCNSLALPQHTKELIVQKVKKAKASLAKLVTACAQNSELLRAAKDVKVKRWSLSPNQSRAVQDLENIRSSFDQAIVQMRLMLAAQRPDDSTQKLFENLEAMVSALNKAERSVTACAGIAAATPQNAEQQPERTVKKSVSDSAVKPTKEEDITPAPKSLNEASASLNASVTSLTDVVEETAQLKLPSATSIEDLTWSVCETVQSFIAAVQTSSSAQVDQSQVQRLNDVLAALTATVADTPSEACAMLDDSDREKVQKEISDVGICSAVLKQAVQNMTILVEESANGGAPVEHVVKKQLANVSEAVEKLDASVLACNHAIRRQLQETSQHEPNIPNDERAARFQEASVSLIRLATSAVTANDKGCLGQLSKLGQTVKQAAMSLMAGMQRHSRPISESQAIRFVAAVNEAVDSLLDTAEYALKSSELEQEDGCSVDTAIETISERCRAAEASARHVTFVTGEPDVDTALPGACEQLAQSFAALTSAIEDVVEARSESPGADSSPQRRVVAENCERVETQLQALCEILIAKPATCPESLDALAEQSEAFYLSLLELLVAVRAQPTENMSSQVMEACMKMRRQLEPLPSLLAEMETQRTEMEMRDNVSKLNKAAMTLIAGSKKSLQLEPSIKNEVLTSWIDDITQAIKEMLPKRPSAAEDIAKGADDKPAQDVDMPSATQADTQDVSVPGGQDDPMSVERGDTCDVVMAEQEDDKQDLIMTMDSSDSKVQTVSDTVKPSEPEVSGKLSDSNIELVSSVKEPIVAVNVEDSPKEDGDTNISKAQIGSLPLTEVEEAVEKLSKGITASLERNSDETSPQTTGAEHVVQILDRLESQIVQQGQPETASSNDAFTSLRQEIVELGVLAQLPSVSSPEGLQTSVNSAIKCETLNLKQSLAALAVCVEDSSGDQKHAEGDVVTEKVKAIATVIENLTTAIRNTESKQTPAESKTPELAIPQPDTEKPMTADNICKDVSTTSDASKKSPTEQQVPKDTQVLEESSRKEIDTSDSVSEEAIPEGPVPTEPTDAGSKDEKLEVCDLKSKESSAECDNVAPKGTVPVEAPKETQLSKQDIPDGTVSKESPLTEGVALLSSAKEPTPMDSSTSESTVNDIKVNEKVETEPLTKESLAINQDVKEVITESTEAHEVNVASEPVAKQPTQPDTSTDKVDSGNLAGDEQSIPEVPVSNQPDKTDSAAKEQLLAACQSLNETSDNFTAALVDALSSQPSPGMLRSRAESISGVIGELAAALSVLTDNENVAPQLQQLNDTVLQLAASVEGSSQTFDDATPLDNRVLEELVAPAIMEVSANIHTLRESVSSFTAQLAEAPTEMISDITASHVALVHEASENISSAVQEVGLAISNAVEKSRTESFVSADEDTSSMLLDDALQDLSESTTSPIGERGGAWRRLSDLEMLEDGKIDTENILNVMSAIGSLKLLQKLAADSESLTDTVGRVSMAVEKFSDQTPAADETPAPTPLEVRAVCGTLHASIDELTSTVRDLVSDANCSELDSSLISKIEDYKDTLLSVSAVTDNLVAGRPELVEDGELIRANIDRLCAQADSIRALTAEKSTIARSLQDAEEAQEPLDAATNEKLQGICSIVTSALEQPQASEAFGIEAELASEAPYLMEVLLHPEKQQRAEEVKQGPLEVQMATAETIVALKDEEAINQTSQNVKTQPVQKGEESAAQMLHAPDSMDDKEKTPTPSQPETVSKPARIEDEKDSTVDGQTGAKQISKTIDVSTAVTREATEDTNQKPDAKTSEKQILETVDVQTTVTEKTSDVTDASQPADAIQQNIPLDDTKQRKEGEKVSPKLQTDQTKTPELREEPAFLKETTSIKEKPELLPEMEKTLDETVNKIEVDTTTAPATLAVTHEESKPLSISETAKIEVKEGEQVTEVLAKKAVGQLESSKMTPEGPITVGSSDNAQKPAAVELASDGKTVAEDVDSGKMTEMKVADTEVPSAAKDKLMEEPSVKTKEPITEESMKLNVLIIDEPGDSKESISAIPQKLEALVIDEPGTEKASAVESLDKLDILSIDEVGVTDTTNKLANLEPLVVDEASVTESTVQPEKAIKLEALAVDEQVTPKAETAEKFPRLKRLSIEGSTALKDANEPSKKQDEVTKPAKSSGEESAEKLVRLKVVLDDSKAVNEADVADLAVAKKEPAGNDKKPIESAEVLPSKVAPKTVESSVKTLADIVRRAVGGEIATIKEAQSAAESVRTALACAAETLQESGRKLPGFSSQTAAIGADLALVTDALQDTIRSIRGTKMATKIQKERIDDMVKPSVTEVCSRVDSLIAAVQDMADTLKSSPTPEANAACTTSADAVSAELQNLSAIIDKSNDVRSDAVERMKGLEDKMVVTEKTAEFKGALRDLLNSVECSLVERGPGSDAVVNLQAASSRHAAAKMVTAVTGVTGDRVLPERAQETIEANIAAVAHEAVAVTARMRGTVPFEELVVVYPPLQERLSQLRQIEEDVLSAPEALADAAETTPVSEFNNLFLESVKQATSSTSALTKVLRDVGEEHANATKVYHGKEARKIVREDLDALRKSTDKFFSSLVGSADDSGPSGNSWEHEAIIVSNAAEGVHKSVNDLHVLEPAVRDSALPLRSGDVMKHASGVINKCAKQLATVMDRVPPG